MKRILSLFLAVIMLAGLCTSAFAQDRPVRAGTAEEALAGKDIYVYAKSARNMQYLLKDGEPWGVSHRWAHLIDDRNGVQREYPAYCLEHGQGAEEINLVNIKEFTTNPVIWGIVTNGFGYKTNGELGVQTDDQAYYATQVAVWSYCMGYDINSFSAGDAHVLAALKQIYAAGIATTDITKPVISAAPDKATVETDGINPAYASQTYTVTANVPINGYTVNFSDIASVPKGTLITDVYNNPKNSFNAGEKFKILVPANEIANKTGAFKLDLTADVKSQAVLYFTNYIAENQDFAAGYDPFEFWDEQITVTYAHQDTYIEIFKMADGTTMPLSGAVFRVTEALGGVLGTFVTDSSGRAVVPLIKDGAYYIDEITAPAGYLLGVNSHQDVTVVWDTPATVTFSNKTQPGLTIRKIDADTGAALRGATFRIAKDGGNESFDVTTDGSGTVYLGDLMPGTFTVTEIAVPEGYILDPTPKSVKLAAGETASVTFKNHEKPGIVIRKYDEATGLLLSGAEFSVAKKGGSIVYEGITGADGTIRVNGLDEGWYTITELAAPKGYLKSAESKDVFLPAGKVVEMKFDNQLRPALTVIKLDAQTHLPLSGARFKVQKTEGGTVSEYVTGANGTFTVYDLDEAVYTVTEISAPDGYVINPDSHKDIQLVWGTVKTLTFTDTVKPTLIIKKYDELTGEKLPGAEFSIAKKGGAVVYEGMVDKNGEIKLERLDEGWYTVTELAAPFGYLKADAKDVCLEAGKVVELKFDNRLRPALKIIKLDAQTNKPLAGARFKVQKTEDATVSEYVTGADGTVTIYNLDEAVYSVWEFAAPDGYLLDMQHKDIELEWGKVKELVFTDLVRPVLEIVKFDRLTRQPLAGVKFRVTKTESNTTSDYITGVDGKITIKNLDAAIYTVEEISVPDSHILEPGKQTIELEGGKTKTLIYENDKKPRLTITKTDDVTKAPLAGAVFNITIKNGRNLGDFTTDSKGEIVFERLDPALYVVTEVKAPDGYAIVNAPQDIQLVPNGNHVVEFRDKALSPLYIKKTDAKSGLPVEGARYRVTKMNGEFVGEYATDRYGFVCIPRLDPGFYTVTEIYAPSGYTIDVTPKTVEVRLGEPAIVEFTDKPFGALLIKKVDDKTGGLLSGVDFNVTKVDGSHVDDYTTDAQGAVLLPSLEPGFYVIRETRAKDGYILDNTPKTVEVKWGEIAEVTFRNKAMSGLQIIKIDTDTKAPLGDAKFTAYRMDGGVVGTYVTDGNGVIVLDKLSPGWYKIAETKAPDGYLIDDTSKDVEVTSDQFIKLVFENRKMSSLLVRKVEAVTLKPLAGAEFSVKTQDGRLIGNYRTAADGTFSIPALSPGWYVVAETKAPQGYILDDNAQTVEITSGKLITLEFQNKPLASIQIKKTDEFTGAPLAGTQFTVAHQGGALVGEFTTAADGSISIPAVEPGWYVIKETKAPQGYVLGDASKTVEVKAAVPTVVTFTNRPLSGIEIIKTDAVTHAPLSGATFTVERDTGERIGTYKTDAAGKIIVSGLPEGTYIVSETIAPDGYIRSEIPKTVIVKSGRLTTVEFENKPLSGIEIIKTDAVTHVPLSGATFTVERDTGERVGTYKTDAAGKIIVSGLPEWTYIVSETIAPDGYIRSEIPKTVVVKSGKLTTVEFENKPLAGLKIVKLDSATRQPIAGVEFSIAKMNGERVENEFRGITFKTDAAGQIYIPGLENGYYTVTEIKQAAGYILDAEPKTVLIQSGKPTILEVLNTPQSGLLIVKTDANTGKPLAGVVFDVTRADGQRVSGSILDGNQPGTEANSPNKSASPNGDITGSYTTDANGRILINGLPAGEYHVVERHALDGYELDTDVHAATVTPGKLATLQLTNKPKAGLRILKIDSLTKAPIYGVEFMLFDQNGNVVGRYITDNNGVIDFTGILSEGRYTIRETKAAAGYYLDEIPKTIEFVSGKVTEIKWENTPQMGQLQIIKKSGDDNEISSLPAGSPLEGAVFEVYNYKTGNLVDRFVSGADGRAVSKPLPLGRYTVREVQAPQWYKLSDRVLDIEIEFPTQIVKVEYLNYSANTGVTIRKTGPYEAMPGDTIFYTIKELRNTSTVPLTDFYWRDILPTDAVRLQKIVTGTYNQALKYKILVMTNKGDQRIIADNLSTTKNNVIDCSGASLGLRSDEYVTTFTLIFGTVKAGFSIVEQPQIYVKVNAGLANGYQFANKVDCGGKYGKEWVLSNSTWLTTTYAKPEKLPRTGY